MPHTSSAKKRLRQGAKRRESNRAAKSAIKTQIKRVLEIAKSGSAEDLQKEYNLAAKRIVHPNMAARKKSQLGRLLQGKKK